MVGKANLNYELELRQIVTRLDTILANHRIEKSNNPLNPKSICESFRVASKPLELDIKSKLIVYKLFDRQVVSKLARLYEGINSFLVDKGILPDLAGYGAAKKNTATLSRVNNSETKQNETKAAADSGVDFLAALKSLLSTQRSALQTSNADTNTATSHLKSNNGTMEPVVDNLQLVEALSTIQAGSEQLPVTDNAYFPVSDLRSKLETILPVSGTLSSQTIGQINDDIIDVISMLFDFILDDKNLPDEFKILIGRLQIPILKVAVIDDTFFSKGNHPARKLLNKMAHAGVGWTEDIEGGAFSLRGKVEKIVTKIIDEFDDDVSLFAESLEEFHLFIESHRNRTSLLERRLREAEEGKAKTETAKIRTKEALEKIVGDQQLPEVAHQIIFDAWQSVMLLVFLREGDESDDWYKNLQVVEELLSSLVAPKTIRLKEELQVKIISLVERLKSGLDSVGYSEYESQNFFQELEKMHTEVLNGGEILEFVAPEDEQIAETKTNYLFDDSSIPDAEELSIELTQIENERAELNDALIIDDPDEEQLNSDELNSYFDSSLVDSGSLYEDDEIMKIVENIQAGGWFELKVQDKPMRVKLAAIISSVGKYIFVNNTGKKIAEYSKLELILEFRRNIITQLDDGALFDRALKSIVSNFRTQKQYLDNGL